MRHIAVFIGNAIAKILMGEKTVESRLTFNKIAPYLCVQKNDEIFLKESGGRIIGKVIVDNALFFDKLNGEKIGKIRKEYGKEIGAADDFWKNKSRSRFATIIFLKNPQRFLSPIKYKKKDRRAWVVGGQ